MSAWIDYDRHARTRPRDDLWGQVRRTVHGQPVAPEQLEQIVHAIRRGLRLHARDRLLDLACGNGALTARLQPDCLASLGVDLSPYLVSIAQERFAGPGHRFIVEDAADYADTEPSPERFTKALCYGSLAYLDDDAVARLLRCLRVRFTGVSRVMLGNLPDPARAGSFYPPDALPDLREPRSAIGTWRSVEELRDLAGPGWTVRQSRMPAGFFAAHYRFDLVLERVG